MNKQKRRRTSISKDMLVNGTPYFFLFYRNVEHTGTFESKHTPKHAS